LYQIKITDEDYKTINSPMTNRRKPFRLNEFDIKSSKIEHAGDGLFLALTSEPITHGDLITTMSESIIVVDVDQYECSGLAHDSIVYVRAGRRYIPYCDPIQTLNSKPYWYLQNHKHPGENSIMRMINGVISWKAIGTILPGDEICFRYERSSVDFPVG
jgi:hypothetical protein